MSRLRTYYELLFGNPENVRKLTIRQPNGKDVKIGHHPILRFIRFWVFLLVCQSVNAQTLYRDPNWKKVNPSTSPILVDFPGETRDSFGRIRVAAPYSVFESQFEYSANGELWHSSAVAGGAITHRLNESSVLMTVGAGAADRAVQQSRVYHRYQPGKSQLILMTGVIGTGTANRKKRIGYFDDYNGVFFESRVDGLYVVLRSSASGSIQETAVSSNSFSGDSLDGTGGSGFNIHLSSSAIFWIDIEWLGVGDIRAGVVRDHSFIIAHTFRNVNASSLPYMATANLPVRYEIANTGAASGTDSLRAICSAVFNEGGQDVFSINYSTSSGTTLLKSVTTKAPILAIRPKISFNGKSNRGRVRVTAVDAYGFGVSNVHFTAVITSAAAGGTWNSVKDTSIVEVNSGITDYSPGREITSGYTIGSTNRSLGMPFENRAPLVVNYEGNGSDILIVTGESLGAGSSSGTTILWEETK